MKIVIATHNAKKLKEMQQLLSLLPITLVPQSDFNIPEAEETGFTFLENALIKARHASALTGLPAIADDSGLAVDCLQGAPGIYSARYAGPHATDEQNNKQLLAALEHQTTPIIAHYHCVIAFLRFSEDPTPIIAQGQWTGEMTLTPQGEGGFGYDPLFYLPHLKCTAAELSAQQKANISHRGQALKQFSNYLEKLL